MSLLKLENVYKIYNAKSKKNDRVVAVKDFNLTIDKKEFIVFVGPSGCGKSTTLRMIAGLEDISEGNIYINDVLVNKIEPKYRNIAMVFQNYALYPHMTAYDNMAFGLRNMKVNLPIYEENEEVKELRAKSRKLYLDIRHLTKKLSKLKPNHDEEKAQLQKQIDELRVELNKNEEEVQKKLVQKVDFNKEVISIIEKELRNAEKNELKPEEIQKLKKDLEYFKNNKVPLSKERHYNGVEIYQMVIKAAKILDIEELLDRRPKNMSGGQRQRVALGRAIVRTPKIFLLDEPLSNLDAKLRAQMRVEITNLYSKLDAPFIYVTHDQVEAMTMGTRIVVLRNGVIQQVDTPVNLYDYPKNRFVAGFLGTPQMNFFESTMIKKGTKIEIKLPNNDMLEIPLKDLRKIEEDFVDGKEHQMIFGIRSENVKLDPKGNISLKVHMSEVLGSETLIYTRFNDNDKNEFIIKTTDRVEVTPGSEIKVSFENNKIHLFKDEPGEPSLFIE